MATLPTECPKCSKPIEPARCLRLGRSLPVRLRLLWRLPPCGRVRGAGGKRGHGDDLGPGLRRVRGAGRDLTSIGRPRKYVALSNSTWNSGEACLRRPH
jgi:hypothetical protein